MTEWTPGTATPPLPLSLLSVGQTDSTLGYEASAEGAHTLSLTWKECFLEEPETFWGGWAWRKGGWHRLRE